MNTDLNLANASREPVGRMVSHHRKFTNLSAPKQSIKYVAWALIHFNIGALQTYVWQNYDLAPDFPEMRKFLDFWQTSLDGPLHSVRYSHQRLIGPNEWRRVDGEFKLQ